MVKFYVYAHKNPLTNKIFYIGKGTGKRAFDVTKRSEAWRVIHSKLKEEGLSHAVEYLHICDSEQEALDLEKVEIAKRPGLTNSRETKAHVDSLSETELSNIIKEIGKTVFHGRIEKNLNKRALAISLGIDRRTFHKIEEGLDGRYELRTLLRILKALGISLRLP